VIRLKCHATQHYLEKNHLNIVCLCFLFSINLITILSISQENDFLETIEIIIMIIPKAVEILRNVLQVIFGIYQNILKSFFALMC